MNTKKFFFLVSISAMLLAGCDTANKRPGEKAVAVPIAGNTYVTDGTTDDEVGQKGIVKWSNPETIISSWFKISQPGELKLYLRAKAEGASTVKVSLADTDFNVKINNAEWDTIPVGKIMVSEPGYVEVDFQGLQKTGEQFAEISDLIIDGAAAAEPLNFVRNFETYWGRRGPSVHMKYTLPKDENVEYFYNEVTVPEGEDVLGSYFMSNGFGEGYFGIQTNSETERRILFSVWSPFNTQNPKEIPEESRIKMLRSGEGVHIGEFGNEGSGGQSYLIYPWKAGSTYKFLTQVKPDGKGNTVYTAYFFTPEENNWRLIASFLRPQTNTWYTNAHSFLENFNPQQGYLTRKVLFGNEWARTTKGEWKELTEGTFTHDATAGAGVRLDYAGGVEDTQFFLKNCGFFNDSTPYKSQFTRQGGATAPEIDFKVLEAIPSAK